VAALVERGDAVRVLRRASSGVQALRGLPVEHCLGDILDEAAVDEAVAGCDLVFHVAGSASYWRSSRSAVYRTNVDGTRVVVQACLRAGVTRVVYTSSVAAVGIRRDRSPADETVPFDALSATFAYADSKHRGEGEVGRAVAQGLDAVIVNPGVVIGAGDHNLISGSLIVEFARGHVPAVLPGGMCIADVDAVVKGQLAAAERGRCGERYILGGENLSHREITAIIGDVVGRRPPVLSLPGWALGPAAYAVNAFNRLNPRPPIVSGDQIRLGAIGFYFDSTKAVRELAYPLMPCRGAVAKAYHWYADHGYLR
jgi:dihydroflavonol-4-reductase